MGIKYDKLFVVARKQGLNKTQLRLKAGISTVTLAKLSKNQSVGIEVIERLCTVLDCQPGEILYFENPNKTTVSLPEPENADYNEIPALNEFEYDDTEVSTKHIVEDENGNPVEIEIFVKDFFANLGKSKAHASSDAKSADYNEIPALNEFEYDDTEVSTKHIVEDENGNPVEIEIFVKDFFAGRGKSGKKDMAEPGREDPAENSDFEYDNDIESEKHEIEDNDGNPVEVEVHLKDFLVNAEKSSENLQNSDSEESVSEDADTDSSDVSISEDENIKNPLIRRLDGEKRANVTDGIYLATQIKLAYNSLGMDFGELDEDSVRSLFMSYMTAVKNGERDSFAVTDENVSYINHFKAFEYIVDVADKDMTLDIIFDLYSIMSTGALGADTADLPNVFEMQKFMDVYEKIDVKELSNLLDFFCEFENLRVFGDIQGSLARLILFKECMKIGIKPVLIETDFKMLYKLGVKKYSVDKGYMVRICSNGQESYKDIMEEYELS